MPILIAVIYMVLVLIISSILISKLCKNDIENIKSNNTRFEEKYENPTISSDIAAILSVFSIEYKTHNKQDQSVHNTAPQSNIKEADAKKDLNFTNEENSIEILKKYKQLLDDGLITEEEYQKKKQELLKL